jgi:hypothetical protein
MVKFVLFSLLLFFDFSLALANTYIEQIQNSAQSVESFRLDRKFGLRTEMGGALGAFSLQLDLNYEPTESLFVGFGKGPGYDSFGFFLKHYFERNDLTLFNTLGYSRWYNTSSQNDLAGSAILQRSLTEEQKNTQVFSLDFLAFGFGIQYSPQFNNYLGFSYFLEATFLYEYKRAKTIPTGGVGIAYNF